MPEIVIVSADPADAVVVSRALVALDAHERRNGRVLPERYRQRIMHVSVAPSGPERPSVADVRPTPDPQPLLLTYAEAGTRLGVSPRTARRLAASGDLRVRRIGRRRFIAADDLAEYVASLSTRKDADASEDPAARPRHRDRAGHRRDRGRTDAA